jgi:tricorn protease
MSPPRYIDFVSFTLLFLSISNGTLWARDDILLAEQPSLSPDGSTVAFSWRGDVWTASIQGGVARRLTAHPGHDEQPKFSPDGTRVAFISDRGLGPQVYIIPTAGGEPRALTSHTAGYHLEGWFPDGSQLLVNGERDHYWTNSERFFRLRVTEPTEDRLAEQLIFDDYGSEGSLSPDGKQLLFVREGVAWYRKGYHGSEDAQIWLFDSASGAFTKLLDRPGGCRWPLWKPDGSGFYFVAADKGVNDLWHYDWKTKQQRRLTHCEDDGVMFPALSHDGSTIVFRRLFHLCAFRPDQNQTPKIIPLVADADETFAPLRRVVLTKATQATFSADGLEIAFVAGGDVWVMDTELREPRQVTDTPEEERDPVFSPDGEGLWFASDRDGQCDIWQARRGDKTRFWWRNDAFPVKRMTDDSAMESDLKFNSDGTQVAFVRGNGDLWTIGADGKNAQRIFTSWDKPEYSWSPDGHWFVYAIVDEDFNRDVWIRPADGTGAAYNVSRHPNNDSSPTWSPDGKLIAFTGRGAHEEMDIHYVWLREQDAETSSHDRILEDALDKVKKSRHSKIPSQAPGSAPADSKTTLNIVIDFEGLYERVRSVRIPHGNEAELFWSPDSKRLAFVATINEQHGLYGLAFPRPTTPVLITSEVGTSPRWLGDGDRIDWLVEGVPASLSPAGKSSPYHFTARQTVPVAAQYRAAFDVCWRAMRDHWYDEHLANRNWDDIRRKYREVAAGATDNQAFATVVSMMLGELNGSHLKFFPESMKSGEPHTWPVVSAHLGVRFQPDYQGPGLKIRDVLPRGPADQLRSRLVAGEIVLTIDGVAVSPTMDLTRVLNGPIGRDFRLGVRNIAGAERELTLHSTTYDHATSLLYDKWVHDNRRAVETVSHGSLGYLHISSMDEPNLWRFAKELYSVAFGKSGLVIDVRENGGGFTADHLLTMLTQPVHAITIPRGGPPGYPQDRKVYATWNKPIVVLCNQNSFSNAEIFSHAIKLLGRGRLVGAPTAGGVISTQPAATIMDIGFLRLPFRGWFDPRTGEDMELNGCVPDFVIWPEPGELPRDKDVQLEKAVQVLLQDVQRWQMQHPPKLRRASERGLK